MKLRLLPFGPLIPVLGRDPFDIETSATTAAELLSWLLETHPQLEPFAGRIALGSGEELLRADTRLQDGAEIALIPPVSGG